MLICTKHRRCYVERHCALQARASDAMVQAQREGDKVVLYLVDRDNAEHVACATLGVSRAQDELAELTMWQLSASTLPPTPSSSTE